MADLRDALLEAMKVQRYTYERLLDDSGLKLKLDITSLHRKLHGRQGMEAAEAQALAKVLGVKATRIEKAVQLAQPYGATVGWTPTKKRGAS